VNGTLSITLTNALAMGVGELGRPIAAGAPAVNGHPIGVEIGASGDPVEHGIPQAFGVFGTVEGRVANARHVDRQAGQAGIEIRLGRPLFLIRVDPAPVHDQR